MTLPHDRRRAIALLALILVFSAAGVLHCLAPRAFEGVTPPWVPYPHQIVILTGLCELAGALGLIIEWTRRLAGLMLALYAVCVYPANIMHAVHDLSTSSGLGWAYHFPRLFAQPFICWWALWVSGAINRPADAANPSERAFERRRNDF